MLDDQMTFSWEDAEAKAKSDEARALIEQMIVWFAGAYEDPAESTPYCSAEGGYMYLCGGPYVAAEEIAGHFAKPETFSIDEWDEIINVAADEIEAENGIDEWAKVIDDPEPEPDDDDPEPDIIDDPEPDEDDPEPDEDVVRLLRAHDHQYGPGHIHRFNEGPGKTLCGRKLENCPGDLIWAGLEDITCKACLSALHRRPNV
jgi:hypothetical protein